jgi:hypothetical protein
MSDDTRKQEYSNREIQDVLAETSGNRVDPKDKPYLAGAVQNNLPDFLAGADRVKRQDLVKSMIYGGTIARYVHGKPKTRSKGSSFRIMEGLAHLTFPTERTGVKILGYLLSAAVIAGTAAAAYFGHEMHKKVKELEAQNAKKQALEAKLYEEFEKARKASAENQ